MKLPRHSPILATAGLCLLLAACAPGGRSPSGFLKNYRQLDAGYGTADTVAVYVKPGVDWRQYDSVIIDPVTTVIATPGVGAETKDQLAAYLATALSSQVPEGIRVVSVPGPRTIRVRTALTDVIEGADSGKPATTVHLSPAATLDGKLGSDALASFISNVSFEGEILDSATGERLSALSDHRMGAKREATADTSWASVRSATNQGAAKLWQRFKAARGG
ncbi:MAG TPA: DUF3313 domain-containing protein [Luteolibacter sp.]|nr:DUF3313 domain-containing protein [Luteolibacter sp.]